MRNTALDARLASAAEFVRQGACFADIGTDHARLPLFLLSSRQVAFAYASDIAEGPLSSAEATLREAENQNWRVLLSDGAKALAGLGITDYAICGMGGELIARIIEESPHLADSRLRLILQPMTRAAHLRRFLAERGFAVIGEAFSVASGRPYVTIAVEYSGEPYSLSPAEEEVGRHLLRKSGKTPAEIAYMQMRLKALCKEMKGAERRGGDARLSDAVSAIRCSLEKTIKEEKEL